MSKPRLFFSLSIAACLVTATAASAQHAGHRGTLPSDTLPPPPFINGIGDAAMSITTSSPVAQKYFDQGLRLIHCFWDFEAYRAFKESARQDPDAAMAYWGQFMSLNYNQHELAAERREALAKARTLGARASDRERRYIEAITKLNAYSGRAAQDAYLREMEALVRAYPEDLQAKLLLIKFLVTDAGGYFSDPRTEETSSSFDRASELLRPLPHAST